MQKFIAAMLLCASSTAFAQSTLYADQAGASAASALNGGQSNLLGNNIGTQVTNTTNNVATTNTTASQITQEIKTVPTVYAPGLTPGSNDTCLGSISGSLTVLGFGGSGGKTVQDTNCVMLKNSARLLAIGQQNAAVIMMMQTDRNVESALRVGNPVLYKQVMTDRLALAQAELAEEYTSALADEVARLNKELRVVTAIIDGRVAPSQKPVIVAPGDDTKTNSTSTDARVIQK